MYRICCQDRISRDSSSVRDHGQRGNRSRCHATWEIHGRHPIQLKYGEPDIVLMDINMPEMDGYATAQWLKEHHPLVNVIALSMYDNENAIIRMFKAGAKGYILKDSEPPELKNALDSVYQKGYYY